VPDSDKHFSLLWYGKGFQIQAPGLLYVLGFDGITPDILSLKTTRPFWRQNTFTFNKPAPLGAKIL
jgi:hypothetical protein